MSDYLKSFSHVNFLKLNLSSTCIGLEYFFLGGGWSLMRSFVEVIEFLAHYESANSF